MQVDVNVILLDFDSKQIILRDPDTKEQEPLSLRKACIEALNALNLPGDNLDGEEKLKRFQLALRIASTSPVELADEERVKIKQLVGKMYSPIVVGRVHELLTS